MQTQDSEAQAADPSPPVQKKRKIRNAVEQKVAIDGGETQKAPEPNESIGKPKKSSRKKEQDVSASTKPHAQSAPAESLPSDPPVAAKIETGAKIATLADFGKLLKAANLTDLDDLKAGLDRKRVSKFVGYLAEVSRSML